MGSIETKKKNCLICQKKKSGLPPKLDLPVDGQKRIKEKNNLKINKQVFSLSFQGSLSFSEEEVVFPI